MHISVAWRPIKSDEWKHIDFYRSLEEEEEVAFSAGIDLEMGMDVIWFFNEIPEDKPAGAWAIYSYDYYPNVHSIHESEEEAKTFLDLAPSGRYFYIFLPFGADFHETLEKSGRPLLEKEL